VSKMMTQAMQKRADRFRAEWKDEGNGYYSLQGRYISELRYIAIPENHPDVGAHYDFEDYGPEVNGGLTFGAGNVFGWDYAHASNTFDYAGDIARAISYFRARESK